MTKVKNRWLIAASAVGIHISIGSVYAWSVYTKPLIEKFGWGLKETQFTFSLAIFFLGISAAFLGHFLERQGPKKSGLLAAIFFGLGIAGSGLAIELESLLLLYFSYGVLGGIGLGIGYIAPVSALLKWFPENKGLASGLAIMGFGFAALISGPVIVKLIPLVGVANTFLITGVAYFSIIFASSCYIAAPPIGWSPGDTGRDMVKKENESTSTIQLTANEAIKTKRFWYMWLMFFINITCGITIISVASPMAQEFAGLTVVAAAAMVGIMGLFNGAGRICWAALSDFLGRTNTYTFFFVLQIAVYFLLPGLHHALLFQIAIFIVISCYGAGFSTIPAYISDLFGTKHLGAILGYMLTAWAVAGMAGPLIAASIRATTNSYNGILYCFAGLLGVALIITYLMRVEIRKLQSAESQHLKERVVEGGYDERNIPEFVD